MTNWQISQWTCSESPLTALLWVINSAMNSSKNSFKGPKIWMVMFKQHTSIYGDESILLIVFYCKIGEMLDIMLQSFSGDLLMTAPPPAPLPPEKQDTNWTGLILLHWITEVKDATQIFLKLVLLVDQLPTTAARRRLRVWEKQKTNIPKFLYWNKTLPPAIFTMLTQHQAPTSWFSGLSRARVIQFLLREHRLSYLPYSVEWWLAYNKPA